MRNREFDPCGCTGYLSPSLAKLVPLVLEAERRMLEAETKEKPPDDNYTTDRPGLHHLSMLEGLATA